MFWRFWFARGRGCSSPARPATASTSRCGGLTSKHRGHARSVAGDSRGGVAVFFAITFPVVLGFAGLAVETGLWYTIKRQAQTAADAAALAGLSDVLRNNGGSVQSVALAISQQNGFANVSPNTVSVFHPPATGGYAGNTQAVQVVVTRQVPRMFSALFGTGNVPVTAKAVAGTKNTGSACILALHASMASAIKNIGNTTVTATDCIMAANSNDATAINFTGSSVLSLASVWTVGSYSVEGAGSLTLGKPATTNAWPLADPYASVNVPSVGACNQTNYRRNTGAATLSPGVYCNGIDIGNATVTFLAGTYILNRGGLSFGSQAVIRCSNCTGTAGVTFVLTSTTSTTQIGTVTVNGGADIDLRAPSGMGNPFRGLLVYQDRSAPSATARFNGGANMVLRGAIYMPRQEVEWSGNTRTNGFSTCTQVVADRITFTGNSRVLQDGCSNFDVRTIDVTSPRVLE